MAAVLLFQMPRAQAQIGIYGEFSAADFNLPNTDWQYGTTFGLYYDRWKVPFLALGVDGRGSVIGSGSDRIISGLAGPRLELKPPVLPLKPFVEALVGAGRADVGEGGAYSSTTRLEYQFLGGADATIFPRVDWRIVEFSYRGFSGASFNPKSLSTGIVLRLP
ncbi:MAG TPA: hypothetical protein VGD62_12170 [Acidobacteriaceae bacterium]